MKELSTEDKAKRYDEAIERANELLYVSYKESLQYQTIKHILPELIENEDEKIRKELIAYCQVNMGNTWHNIKQEDYIAWLEKQNEQKPAEWSKRQVVNTLTSMLTEKIKSLTKKLSDGTISYREEMFRSALVEIRAFINSPSFQIEKDISIELSEEDEFYINQLIVFCENCMVQDNNAKKCANWLKSLKQRYTWKPSEVQIQCLQDLIDYYKAHGCGITTLKSLYCDLKQLK